MKKHSTSTTDRGLGPDNGVLHYHDTRFGVPVAKLLPGAHWVVEGDNALATVLGSCVAACLRDPLLHLGGMNHFLLPEGGNNAASSARYGCYAMELLINDLLKRGAVRKRLQAKVFGGANVLKGMQHNPIGSRNADFVLHYLATEHIPVIAQDLRGIHPRRVYFFTRTGKALIQRLPHAHDINLTTTVAQRRLLNTTQAGSIELFD